MIRLPKRLTFRISPALYDEFCQFRRKAGSPWWDESEHLREAIRLYVAKGKAVAQVEEKEMSDKAPGRPTAARAKRQTRSRK